MEETIEIPAANVCFEADLALPPNAGGLIVFAYAGSGGRRSSRLQEIPETLHQHGLGTLSFDLLDPEGDGEAVEEELRFDVPRLTVRLGEVTDWLVDHPPVRELPIGYFGSTTGAAAALIAAAARPRTVRAVVSRGGRTDLVGSALSYLPAPTLLAVGGDDTPRLESNRKAVDEISSPSQLHVVPGAADLFENPDTVEELADVAGNWFARHLDSEPERPQESTRCSR